MIAASGGCRSGSRHGTGSRGGLGAIRASADMSSAGISAPSNPDADAKSVEDDGRLEDGRRIVIDRLGIDRWLTRIALPIRRQIVSVRTRWRHLGLRRRGSCPQPEGERDDAWKQVYPHRTNPHSGSLIGGFQVNRSPIGTDRCGKYREPSHPQSNRWSHRALEPASRHRRVEILRCCTRSIGGQPGRSTLIIARPGLTDRPAPGPWSASGP
jgi:hypothetical protein